MKALKHFIWSTFGNCSFCTRKAFRFATMAIVISVGCSFFLPKAAILPIAFCAVCLMAVWIAHIIVFSLKTLARREESVQAEAPLISRRKLFGTFAQIAAVAALSSAMPQMVFASRGRSSKWCVAQCVQNGVCNQDCQNQVRNGHAKQTAKKKSS